jgi:hypothetical protein
MSLLANEGTRSLPMVVTFAPEVEELDTPPTETLPLRRPGGWSIQPQPRVGLALGSDDEMLMLENRTEVSWLVYHNYHHLGIIDVGELLVFHLYKHGSLSVRPWNTQDEIEYLVLSLNNDVNFVYIYRRTMSKELEVYDMRALLSSS